MSNRETPANPARVNSASNNEEVLNRPGTSTDMVIEDVDHKMFEDSILKPSVIATICKTFKTKAAMLNHLQWYFRPRNAYEPDRVDYNALNILAEYQVFNLEFCKQELSLNDKQTASVLDLFWSLLEFDPDQEEPLQQTSTGIEIDSGRTPQLSPTVPKQGGSATSDGIAYLGDDVQTKEEETHQKLLEHKFGLLRDGVMAATERDGEEGCRITVEQARRVARYAKDTYFKHLRLYDFVLKNTKLCEVKRVNIAKDEPKCGDLLSKAMVLDDKVSQVWYENEDDAINGEKSTAEKHETSIIENENQQDEMENTQHSESATDTELEDLLKQSTLVRKSKKIVHYVSKDWNQKIDSQLVKESEEVERALTTGKKR